MDLGIDVSSLVSKQQFGDLMKSGFKYLIVRAYRSLGAVDTNAPVTIKNARAAGMTDVDVYLFPDVKKGNPEEQVTETVDYLRAQNAQFGTLWLDVEIYNWTSDHAENQKFFTLMYNKAKSLCHTGVYTSANGWTTIMGNDFTGGSTAPLWYPRFDGNPSFSDFVPFGGWTKPFMKQFTNTETICGVKGDKNWRP